MPSGTARPFWELSLAQLSRLIKCHIPVHHAGKTDTADGRQVLPVLILYVLRRTSPFSPPWPATSTGSLREKRCWVSAKPRVCSPLILRQKIMPVMGSHRNGIVAFVHQHRLNAGGAKLNSQNGLAVPDIGFSGMMHGYMAFNQAGELLVPFRTWRCAFLL